MYRKNVIRNRFITPEETVFRKAVRMAKPSWVPKLPTTPEKIVSNKNIITNLKLGEDLEIVQKASNHPEQTKIKNV